MKHFLLSSLLLVALLLNLKAQSPQGFSYQAVARNSNGLPLPNSNVSLRITLLQGTINGSSVYQETFATNTDAYGILNLNIGNGTAVSGNFTNINWGSGPYFVKVELDPKGGSSYEFMGTSQLMSVPYALYAATSGTSVTAGGIQLLTQSQIDSLNPTTGMLVYNTDYQQLQFFNGKGWTASTAASGCTPRANVASLPQFLGSMTNSIVLPGTPPSPGIKGKWSVVAGNGGSFTDATQYNTTFTGTLDSVYNLQWSLFSKCDSSTSTTNLMLNSYPVAYNNYTLMVSPVDNAVNTVWAKFQFPFDSITTYATSTDGQVNTSLIVNKLGTDGGISYAAKVCDTLTLGGHTDWYLPSKEELGAIIAIPYASKYFAPLFSSSYWSSTEVSSSLNAWAEANGTLYPYYSKHNTSSVRCVRKE